MKKNKTIFFVRLFFPVFFFLVLWFLPAYASEKESVSFYWTFLQCNLQGDISPLDTEQKIRFPGENFFKIYLKAEEGVFLYLFHFSHEKELNLLFPESSYLCSPLYPPGPEYYFPAAEDWFTLDGRGEGRVEKFYLLASASRLKKLERLTEQYLASPAPEAKQQVINQILSLKNRASSFAAPVENHVMITTRFRAGEESSVIHVEAGGLYARIIRLEY